MHPVLLIRRDILRALGASSCRDSDQSALIKKLRAKREEGARRQYFVFQYNPGKGD